MGLRLYIHMYLDLYSGLEDSKLDYKLLQQAIMLVPNKLLVMDRVKSLTLLLPPLGSQ